MTAKLADSKSSELIRVSITRARLCELAGEARGFGGDASELFLLDLFSLMDAILDVDMEEVVNDFPVSDRLKLALIKKEGELANYLNAVSSFERGRWDDVSQVGAICDSLNLTIEKYVEAVEWAEAYTRII